MRSVRAYLLLGLLAVCPAVSAHAQTLTDFVYNFHHPRLLFTAAELPALRAKLSDGGVDDATYQDARHVVQDVYPTMAYSTILSQWYGDQAIPCIGIVAHAEQDEAAFALGKALTMYLVNTYGPDNDEANSGMRLRALALGYDLFFRTATTTERAAVRDEIVQYMQKMAWTPGYQMFETQPYLGNHSAMFGASLGLAGIALQGETESYLTADALATADRIAANLMRWQFDPDGAYNEGALYGMWTLKQLVYYFDARHRFDGRAYTDDPQFRAIEEWLAYEIAPAGGGRTHNLNDSPLNSPPLPLNPTYLNWAMGMWNSGLSAWLWNHTAGGLGMNLQGDSDWTGTILWHRSVAPIEPGSVLPPSRLWLQRGLYYYRSGWPSGASSSDVVFNFYSGKFQGGHAQEDQNQFALTAYGTPFVIDHGAGSVAKESESHNMVFVDGLGQHNAGSSIGTDGAITEFVLGSFADYVTGDATRAYGTYSEFNAPDVPYPGADWSWGYSGANPVRFALRRVVMVHGAGALPYAVVIDDIDKDGAAHAYQWRLHTAAVNTVNATANPIIITGATAEMQLHLLDPDFSSVTVTASPYNAANVDPASTLIGVSRTAVNPRFTFLLIPRASGTAAPAVTRQAYAWGCGATISWGGGLSDVIVRNDSGVSAAYGSVTTDAALAVVRKHGSTVVSYLMAKGRSLSIGNTSYASFNDAAGSCEFSDDTVHLDRFDADFRILDTGVQQVVYRDQDVGFMLDQGYLVPDGVTGVGAPPAPATLWLGAQPNPFNPGTVIHIRSSAGETATVTIYDVAGRRVRALWSGPVGVERALAWDGRNDRGAGVASGAYFVRVETASQTRSLKITLVK